MAYTDPTVLLTKQGGNLMTELRDTNYGLLRSIERSTPFYKGLTPEISAFIASQMDRTFQMQAIPEQTITTTSSESFTIPDNLSTTETKTGTLYTVFTGFKVYDAMFAENAVGKEAYIMNKMKEVDKAMATAKTATMLTIVDGQKSQVLPQNAASNDGYSFAASVLTVNKLAQQERMFQNISAILEDNGLSEDKEFAVSTGIKVLQNYTDMYGAANAMDLQNQGFIPEIHVDNRITNAASWTGYLFEKGAFAAVDNIKWDFLNRTRVDEAIFDVSNNILPSLGSQVGVYYNRFKNDASSLQSTTSEWSMTTGEEYGFVHRYAVLTPYNSDIANNVNPVVKIVGATS